MAWCKPPKMRPNLSRARRAHSDSEQNSGDTSICEPATCGALSEARAAQRLDSVGHLNQRPSWTLDQRRLDRSVRQRASSLVRPTTALSMETAGVAVCVSSLRRVAPDGASGDRGTPALGDATPNAQRPAQDLATCNLQAAGGRAGHLSAFSRFYRQAKSQQKHAPRKFAADHRPQFGLSPTSTIIGLDRGSSFGFTLPSAHWASNQML